MVLLAVPLHTGFRAEDAVLTDDDYLDPACRTRIEVLPEPICPEVAAGESPATVQAVTPFGFTFPVVDGERRSPFEADAGCGLVNCGLDNTIFHLVQLPFLLAMAVMAHRLYTSTGEARA